MLSDEEKEAIDFFEKSFKKKIPPYWYDDTISNIEEKIKVILNLIKKQSKEIEELERNRKVSQNFAKIVATDYISKDKIKAKIEESEKQQKEEPDAYLCIKVLQSLLEKE